MNYSVAISQGGWVIQVFSNGEYLGNVSKADEVSKTESLAFFKQSDAMDYAVNLAIGV